MAARNKYRKDIKALFAGILEKERWQGQEVRELWEGKWEKEFEVLLRKAKKTLKDVETGKKSAKWNVDTAREMRRTTTATNAWLAKALAMGHPSRVCNLINGI